MLWKVPKQVNSLETVVAKNNGLTVTKMEETLEKIQVFWDRGPFLGPGAVFGRALPSKKKVVSQSKIPQNMKPPQTKNQAWTFKSMNNPTRDIPTQLKISKKTKKVGSQSKILPNMTPQTTYQRWTIHPWTTRPRKLNGIKVKKNKNIKKCLAWSCLVLFLIGLCILLGFFASKRDKKSPMRWG